MASNVVKLHLGLLDSAQPPLNLQDIVGPSGYGREYIERPSRVELRRAHLSLDFAP